MRRAVGEFALATDENDKSSLWHYLTWDELVHTSYFKLPAFRKLVCYAIAHSEGFRPSERLKADADYEKLGRWMAEIQGTLASLQPLSGA
jgi:hypothetical protein